jgi:radical SAM superfamily enzyme YgiQ (UPF0313 family)
MHVLFVYPNLYTQMGFNHGLASLSAVLKRAGHSTGLVNLNENLPPVPSDEEVFQRVLDERPGLIGFSCLTQQYPAALELARFLRKRADESQVELPPLVVGGIHPTMVPDDVLGDGAWDYVGVGECEQPLLELVERVASGERPTDVANFRTWKGGALPADSAERHLGNTINNPVGPFPDLAELPEPDYALFDTARITANKHGWFGLMTTRGCPYRCSYCLNHRIVDRYRVELDKPVKDLNFLRERPVDLMMAEIRGVLERYEVGTFILDDDLFTQHRDHALAFCAAYEQAGFDVPFVVNAHVKRLDPELAAALGKAGCKILKLGIESGSVRVRAEVLDRHMTNADICATVDTAEAHGLHTSAFVMVGLPGETEADLWDTVNLLAEADLGRFRTSLFFPFPGTRGADLALEGGYVDADKVATLTDFTRSSALDFGAAQNLLIDKLATAMPWFVNARSGDYREGTAAERYRGPVEELLAMDRAAWEAFKPTFAERDAELSRAATAAGELHYAVRYNAFMGVRSDFFLAEDVGLEWSTAAAKPVPERLAELALLAAAEEIA